MKVKLVHINTKEELEFNIRLFNDKDVNEVIQCIRAEYGDTYFKKQFYNPEYLIKMNNENAISLIVAETKNGDIAGIIVLKSFFPGDTMCELATEIFKKEYRGYRLSEKMIQYGMKIIEERCYSSIYALPVTFHSISQRLLKRNGLIATGFIFSVFISSKIESSYEYGKCLKHSQGIQIKPLEKTSVGTLFVDNELIDITKKIYEKLNVEYYIGDKEVTKLSYKSKTMLFHNNNDNHRNCAITIIKVGNDILEKVDEIIEKYRKNKLQTFNVFLNINDKNAISAYKKLKDRGFFFTGFKALCNRDEYMVMHFNNSLDLCTEDYILTDEFKSLLEDIKPFINNN